MPIVRALGVEIEDLRHFDRLPSVCALRPSACPHCRNPAHRPGEPLGIVGHGTYERQVLGLEERDGLVIHVRRYLCRGCNKTIAVLPGEVLPWRWYAGTTILLALVGSLLLGRSAGELRDRFAPYVTSPGWKSLERWHRALFDRLWSWRADEIGLGARRCPSSRAERAAGLKRLLALVSVEATSPDRELASAACSLAIESAHTRSSSWRLTRAS